MSFFNSIGRSMGRGKPSANSAKRSPEPGADSNGRLQAKQGLTGPRISPSLSSRSASNGYSNGAHDEGLESPGASHSKPLYLCSPFVEAALVKGNFKTIVMLPKYVDIMEWVAVNIFDFYTNLNEFYGVISECCTAQTCKTMSAGPTLSYTWINQDRKSVHLPATTYIDYVMTWVQNLLDDENTFPTKSGQDFPPNFPSTIKHVYRQLLRVFAHIYHAHFQHLLHMRSEPHFNSLFAHFLAFGKEYELLEIKDVKGANAQGQGQVGIGGLWDKWREMGILD